MTWARARFQGPLTPLAKPARTFHHEASTRSGDATMIRSLALLLALALGFTAAAQACGDNAKHTKPDMSKPAAPKTGT